MEDLRNDVYPVNSLLPPEPKLEEIYHVSRTTVRRAIAQLADEGYVKVKQSRNFPGYEQDIGTFYNTNGENLSNL